MNRMKTSLWKFFMMGAVSLLLAAPLAAQQDQQSAQAQPAHVHHHHAAPAPADSEPDPTGPTTVAIPDVVVMDQNGNKVHFYSDLIKGRTVAVDFIFTTCTTICPPLTANFAKIQKSLIEQGKTGVRLISVSVDPEVDTPEKMKNYAEMFHAQPGWTFVTGTRTSLEQIWRAFSINASVKLDHPATVVIGNDATHSWTYASGLASAGKLVNAVNSVLESKDAVGAPHHHGEAKP